MLFKIAEANKQRAAHAFTVERLAHEYGYKKSAMLYPKSNRIMHYYEIDMLDADRIICTVRHKNTDCIVALVWLSGYTPESIEVEQAELYRNCSNYPYRREYNSKYLKKYDQIACIVHGAIINGLLFDAEIDKEPEAVTDTTTTETEPQRATETAQKTADDTTTAGSNTDRTEAAQTEEKTIQTGARLYSHPHRHMVTVEGLHEGLVMVVYRGRLYLVSRADLYTDDTETTPAILPAEEAAQPTTDREEDHASDPATTERNGEARTAYHRPTPEEIQNRRKLCLQMLLAAIVEKRHRTPRQTAQNATERTKGTPHDQVPTKHHKRPYKAKCEATTGGTGRTESARSP